MTRNTIIDNVTVTVHGEITNQELAIYIDEYQAKRKDKMIRAVVTVEAQEVKIQGYVNMGWEEVNNGRTGTI
jgi:hypothetical protein